MGPRVPQARSGLGRQRRPGVEIGALQRRARVATVAVGRVLDQVGATPAGASEATPWWPPVTVGAVAVVGDGCDWPTHAGVSSVVDGDTPRAKALTGNDRPQQSDPAEMQHASVSTRLRWQQCAGQGVTEDGGRPNQARCGRSPPCSIRP